MFRITVLFLCLITLVGCSRSMQHLTPEEFMELGKQSVERDGSFTVEFIGCSSRYSYIEYRIAGEEPQIFYIKTDRLPEGIRREISSGVNPFPSGIEE